MCTEVYHSLSSYVQISHGFYLFLYRLKTKNLLFFTLLHTFLLYVPSTSVQKQAYILFFSVYVHLLFTEFSFVFIKYTYLSDIAFYYFIFSFNFKTTSVQKQAYIA